MLAGPLAVVPLSLTVTRSLAMRLCESWLVLLAEKLCPPEIWSELESTYVGAGIEENWDALFRTLALFRKVAVEVAGQLGYAYPHDVHRRVVVHAQRVRGVK